MSYLKGYQTTYKKDGEVKKVNSLHKTNRGAIASFKLFYKDCELISIYRMSDERGNFSKEITPKKIFENNNI